MTHVSLEVVDPGPLTTVQDLGRPGLGSLGVSPSGAADRASARRANALVGNPVEAAVLEVTFGGLVLRARGDCEVALAGAEVASTVEGAPVAGDGMLLGDGATLRLGRPSVGVRTYLAVRGGVDVEPVLGSRSTDLLSGLGPAPLARGDVLPVGALVRSSASVGTGTATSHDLVLPLLPGPRLDWFGQGALDRLVGSAYAVLPDSNRIALRLAGQPVVRSGGGELASEGLVRGALQVPPTGQPVLFLADHPVTGGYPVIAVVPDETTDAAAQARPGTRITFRAGWTSH
ncbi:MAG TPA: biotin-dependent carboxyltransferase family protein [Actinomycetes bacterium]